MSDVLLRLELWLNTLVHTASIRYHIIPIVLKDGQCINIMVYDSNNNVIEINVADNGLITVIYTHYGEIITACIALVGDSALNNPAEIIDIDFYGTLKIPMFLEDKCMHIMSIPTTPQQQHRIPAPARPTT